MVKDGCWVLLADMSKAFDRVHHAQLLQHLANIDLHSRPLAWVDSYMSGWRQRVMANGSYLVRGYMWGPQRRRGLTIPLHPTHVHSKDCLWQCDGHCVCWRHGSVLGHSLNQAQQLDKRGLRKISGTENLLLQRPTPTCFFVSRWRGSPGHDHHQVPRLSPGLWPQRRPSEWGKPFKQLHFLTVLPRQQPTLPAAIRHVTKMTHTRDIHSMTCSHILKQTIQANCWGGRDHFPHVQCIKQAIQLLTVAWMLINSSFF